ncbi:MAG: glycerol-3-phosphate 1-O-acyltransferase PlsY [Proteobacteria bacterium]|nr:glycerol-3-phosphate 1-O-acyltransferase PlsY [Pseudomonadota bacterium]
MTFFSSSSLLLFLMSYFLGSIPFGLIWTRLFLKQDIRTIGSSNIGATNVLRTGSKHIAALTLFCDALKGSLAVFMALYIGGDLFEIGMLGLCGVVIGHTFPIWLQFKGGKGVATLAGGVLVLLPFVGALALLTWGIVFAITRISSLSALIAVVGAPFSAICFYPCPLALENLPCVFSFLLFLALCILVLCRHSDNIVRLWKGEEKSFKKK